MWHLLCDIHLLLNSLTLDFLSSLQRSLNSPLQYCQRCCKNLSFPQNFILTDHFLWLNSPKWFKASLLSRLHDYTQTLLWTSISPTKTPLPNNTQQSQETNIHASGGNRTLNPSMLPAADVCLRQGGHWDRQLTNHAAMYCLITLCVIDGEMAG